MGGPRHILMVEEDNCPRHDLARQIRAVGPFLVTEAPSLAGGLAMAGARDSGIEAVLIMLGDRRTDGLDLCLRLRRRGIQLPILIQGESSDERDVVRCLDAGANDYIAAPVRIAELAARLRAQIRAHESSEDAALIIGPYRFRPAQKLLQDITDNRSIRLTEKEAAVLKFLYKAGDTPVARRTLLHEVWGYSAGADTHTVETHIYRLRRKIEPDPTRIRLLVNVDGGYRLETHRRPTLVRLPTRGTDLRLAAAF